MTITFDLVWIPIIITFICTVGIFYPYKRHGDYDFFAGLVPTLLSLFVLFLSWACYIAYRAGAG